MLHAPSISSDHTNSVWPPIFVIAMYGIFSASVVRYHHLCMLTIQSFIVTPVSMHAAEYQLKLAFNLASLWASRGLLFLLHAKDTHCTLSLLVCGAHTLIHPSV
jgi:hypothetical protein